jgi:hypothetical protein
VIVVQLPNGPKRVIMKNTDAHHYSFVDFERSDETAMRVELKPLERRAVLVRAAPSRPGGVAYVTVTFPVGVEMLGVEEA